jgi:hypothetical protein
VYTARRERPHPEAFPACLGGPVLRNIIVQAKYPNIKAHFKFVHLSEHRIHTEPELAIPDNDDLAKATDRFPCSKQSTRVKLDCEC